MGSILLETSRQEKLLRVMDERGFTLSQQNGQRIYGGPPPNWGGRIPPSRESEIFIGRIPRLCFEDELIPLFSSIGELYEFRLMLDFSGTNRGFAYAQYTDEESAFKAIKLLNNYEIRPGHCIGVLRCKNNCRLLFSNIKEDMSINIFGEQIHSLTRDILKISMYKNFEELKTLEIGVNLVIDKAFQDRITRYAPESKFGIVEYETHKAAAVARRILIPKLGHVYGIDWAIPPKDSIHFDHGLSARFDASLVAGYDFLNIRPVPTFSPRSSLDAVLYIKGIFKNIFKYFKYLVNTTLHKSMRKGDIPPPVYWDLERKIIDRMKNIEHCSQATQLILNYLNWYREKMMMFIDPESEKILIEVKYYAEKIMKISRRRVAHPRGNTCCLGEQFDDTLPANLNFCYYMAVFLGGDDRIKVCGLITDSLDWLSRMMQRAKDGNLEVNQFLNELTKLAIELEEEKRKSEPFAPRERVRKRKPELILPPTQNVIEWSMFSGQSVPPLKKSAVTSSEQYQDSLETDSGIELPNEISVNEGTPPTPYSPPCEVTSADSMDVDSSVSPSVLSTCQVRNATPPNSAAPRTFGAYEYWPNTANPFCVIPQVFNRSSLPRKIASNGHSGDESVQSRRMMALGNVVTETRIARLKVPTLVPEPYATDFSIMPRQFLNILPYFKYITTVNLQKTVERCELTLQTYTEMTTNIIEKMTNMDEFLTGIRIIVTHIKCSREGLVNAPHKNLVDILDDVTTYGASLVNHVRNRRAGMIANPELDDYYLCLVPNQMSFLYHLTLLLDEEEKEKLSGRLVDSLKWLHELVQKNIWGDIGVVAFFEKITIVGEKPDANPGIREVIKEVYEEFNTISLMTRRAGN